MRDTVTANSSRAWLDRHILKLERYLRRYHKREDRGTVFDLIFMINPDEGRKLIQNYDLSMSDKIKLLLNFIVKEKQLTFLTFGDQRMGKDASVCFVIEAALQFCAENSISRPRVVTLGNIRCPPFVDPKDMYFSFKSIPPGTSDNEVWIYCSEIETVLPAREGSSPENKLFSQLEGTLAQNHQKLFGCVKLAAKVDINALRSCNVKLFKFISPEKLLVENVERANIVSPLGNWLLPRNRFNKSECLLSFDNHLLTINLPLPPWWTEEYSEQFRDIPFDKIQEYIEVVYSNGLNKQQIQIAVAQKFRHQVSFKQIDDILGFS